MMGAKGEYCNKKPRTNLRLRFLRHSEFKREPNSIRIEASFGEGVKVQDLAIL
jgi:hypothetical protein